MASILEAAQLREISSATGRPSTAQPPEAQRATPAAARGQTGPGELTTAFPYKSFSMKLDGKSIKVPSAPPCRTPLQQQPLVSVPSAAGGDTHSASSRFLEMYGSFYSFMGY